MGESVLICLFVGTQAYLFICLAQGVMGIQDMPLIAAVIGAVIILVIQRCYSSFGVKSVWMTTFSKGKHISLTPFSKIQASLDT